MIKSRYYVSDIVTGVLFFLLPLWSLPLLVFQLCKTRRIFYTVLFSSFFGIMASLLAPTGDLYRLYLTYYEFRDYDFQAFLNFLSLKPDFLFYTLLYIFAKLGLSIRIIIFSVVFGFFQLSFNYLLSRNIKIRMVVVLLFVMQFDFLLQGLFLRFPLAMLLVIYSFLKKMEGKRYALLLLLIASAVHFSALIAIPVLLFKRMAGNRINVFLFISLFLIPFGSFLFIFLIRNVLHWFPNIPFHEKLNDYFLGYWALEFYEERSWKALFQVYTERILYFILLSYFLLTKGNSESRKTAVPFLILINILFSFPNLFSRYLILALFFGLLCVVLENKKNLTTKVIRLGLAVSITLVFTTRLLAQQKNIRVSYIPNIAYNNVLTLSLKKYDPQWIHEHIDKNTARPKTETMP